MLEIVGQTPGEKETLEIGPYSPFTIWWDPHVPMKYWWYTGNHKTSLLEIGIDAETGRLCKVVLVILDECIIKKMPDESHVPSERGIPVCSTDKWPNEWPHVREDPNDLSVYVCKENIRIAIGPLSPLSKVIQAGPVSFGLDEVNGLRSIALQVTKEEIHEFLLQCYHHISIQGDRPEPIR